MDLTYFQDRLDRLIAHNADRNEMFEAIDDMDHGDWDHPEEFDDIEWVEPLVSPGAHDVLQAGARIIAGSGPTFTVMPQSLKESSPEKIDLYERGLRALFLKADIRREATVLEDTGFSLLKYAEACVSVIFLPEQIRSAEVIGGNTTRYKALKRGGDFVVTVHNAKSIYTRYSDLGLEEVGVKKEMDPYEVLDLFGEQNVPNLAAQIQSLTSGQTISKVIYNEYLNFSKRAVWIEVDTDAGAVVDEITNDDWLYPFLPWACRVVGTSTETEQVYKYRPLLYTAYHFDLYDLMNRVRSLRYSEMVRNAGKSRLALFSDSELDIDIDPASPDLLMRIEDTEAKLQDLPPNMPDPAMTVLSNELSQDLESSTLSKILMGAQPAGGTAFATLNLATHSAAAVLEPFQEALKKTMADVATIMLLWLHWSPAASEIMVEGLDDDNLGDEYHLKAEDILPNRVFVISSLEADIPTNEQQKALTAINLSDRGIVSKRGAMAKVGITDAAAMEEEIIQEKLDQNELQIYLRNRARSADTEFQQSMLQQAMLILQKQMEQAQMEQSMEEIPEQGQPYTSPRQRPGTSGIEGVEGEMTSPPQGGSPAAIFSPYQTREQQTQTTRTGEDIAEV